MEAEPLRVEVRDRRNQPVGELELPGEIFRGPVRAHLLYEAVKMQQANRRAGTASTKTRGFVSGGGRKPWRQKGTGRARAGSIRSPLWVGGATVFGPQPRDYSYRMPQSARRSALQAALALKARENRLLILDRIEVEGMKTKHVVQLMRDLGLRSALFVIPSADPVLENAARNLPHVKVLRAEGTNVLDLLRYEHAVIARDAVGPLIERAR